MQVQGFFFPYLMCSHKSTGHVSNCNTSESTAELTYFPFTMFYVLSM